MNKEIKALQRNGGASIIYADPAWNYENNQDGDSKRGGIGYKQMLIADMMALPVADLAAKDCALFMWATFPKLVEAFMLMKAWGFNYRTCAFVWVKLNPTGKAYQIIDSWLLRAIITLCRIENEKVKQLVLLVGGIYSGMGNWTNGNAEICLFAKRGAPKRQRKDVKQIIIAPRAGKHSTKPLEARKRIVELMGAKPRIELFARDVGEGWAALGGDIDGEDLRDSIPALANKIKAL